MINEFAIKQSIDDWVIIIEKKFSDISIINGENTIAKILGVTDEIEITKIKQANLLAYARKYNLVTSYEEACNKLGVKIKKKPNSKARLKFYSFECLSTIIKALNNGWYPDWNNLNEYKYYPYFDMRSGGFSCRGTYYYIYSTAVASALCLKSKELSWYSGNMFLDLYKDYYE